MGRHQYDDVPEKDIEQLADDEDDDFKDYDDDDAEKQVYMAPARRMRRQSVSYAEAAVITPPKPP